MYWFVAHNWLLISPCREDCGINKEWLQCQVLCWLLVRNGELHINIFMCSYAFRWQLCGRVFTALCLCVWFSAWYLKKRCCSDHQTWRAMFHNESWKIVYFGFRRSRSRFTKTVGVGFALLQVLASFSWSFVHQTPDTGLWANYCDADIHSLWYKSFYLIHLS